MSQYKLSDINQSALPTHGVCEENGLSVVPVSSNYEFLEWAGRGFILEEGKMGLIRLYNFGSTGLSDLCLLTEDGLEIYTSGTRESSTDRYNNQPLLADI